MKMTSPARSAVLGFSLIELLVAVVIFAAMAALAYGGLDSIVRTRGELNQRAAEFRGLMRSVESLDRDLREATSRPVRGNYGEPLAAFSGSATTLEFTRMGFANPQAETRSNLERVTYELDGAALKRGNFSVLDRAPASVAQMTTLRDAMTDFRLRYLDETNRWSDVWPPLDTGTDPAAKLIRMPRAVEFRLLTRDYGEITHTVQLVSAWSRQAAVRQ